MFPKNNKDHAIRGSEELGRWFAYFGFRDEGRCNLSQGKFHYKGKDKEAYENYGEIIPNNKNDILFDVIEVEIYKIYE